ncbi:MAG: zinc-ribbon domain-containing protein, partial [Myxococcota bacterium]
MDVTCPRCATEYEFDAALVARRGTTVKCTTCEHLFQVMPPAGAALRPWLVRRADGASWELSSLKGLQLAIARGELGPADTLSRGDGIFRPLGAIAELTSLFADAQARPSGPPRADTVLDAGPPTARPVRLTSSKATLAGVGR